VFDELLDKNWPPPIRERLSTDFYPFMLVIRADFANFDPQADQWALIWFREFRSDPTQVIELFGRMARKIKLGEDAFGYLAAFAVRDRAGRWARYFEFKPGIFGVSIDASAVLQDLLKIAND
jgi:hypothetical protein